MDDEPTQIGVYSFEVQSGSLVGIDTDHQYINRDLPVPDESRFAPANGALVDSKTPMFTWPMVNYSENVPLYYRLEIIEEDGTLFNRIFDTGRIKDLAFFTLPLNVLKPDTNYRWRIRLTDNDVWENVQNRSNSAWMTFTTSAVWAAHDSPPVVDPDGWNSVTWNTENGTQYLCSVTVIDLDGVSSGGFSSDHLISHTVQVAFPGGGPTYDLSFDGATSPTSAYYYVLVNGTPPAGAYTITVNGPDSPPTTWVENFSPPASPLAVIGKRSIAPTLKDEFITVTFDNVFVNGSSL